MKLIAFKKIKTKIFPISFVIAFASFFVVVAVAYAVTTISSNIETGGYLSVTGAATFNDNVTLGNAVADVLTINGTISGASPLVFEGATDNAFETTFTITDPTADRTITFQNSDGIVPLGTANNTLFFTTSGATNITLPTSGTLTTLTGTETLTNKTLSTGSTWAGNTITTPVGGTGLSAIGTANQLLGTNTGGTALEYKTLSGTANQITVTLAAGSLTLSTPQNIHTGASPTFTGLTLSGLTTGSILFAGTGGLLAQDNTNLFWDDTNNRLGIGTTAPNGRLHVVDGTFPWQFDGNGNIGHGISSGQTVLYDAFQNGWPQISATGAGVGFFGIFRARSSRGTTAAPTATQSGDTLGQFEFGGRGASAYVNSTAYIQGLADETFTNTAAGSRLAFYTTPIGSTTAVERIRINNAGNVGIGTTTPGTKLKVSGLSETTMLRATGVDVTGASGPGLEAGWDSGNSFAFLQGFDRTLGVRANLQLNGNNLIFGTGGAATERMRIDSNGNVGIGTTAPASLLEVASSGYFQFSKTSAGAPTATDCDTDAERGRLVIDTTNNLLYVCNGATRGWDSITLTN